MPPLDMSKITLIHDRPGDDDRDDFEGRFPPDREFPPDQDQPDPADEGLGEWDAGDDIEPPPPRGWLLGNIFCRNL